MKEIKNQITILIQEIDEVSDCLYQQKLNKGYERLNHTLAVIMGIADQLFTLVKKKVIFFDEQRFLGNLNLAMNAMEEKDSVLLADILYYEISGQLQEIVHLI